MCKREQQLCTPKKKNYKNNLNSGALNHGDAFYTYNIPLSPGKVCF